MPSTSWGMDAYSVMEGNATFFANTSGDKKLKKVAQSFNKWIGSQYNVDATPEELMRSYYFSGYNSMSEKDRKAFNARYPEISKLKEDTKDIFFKNKLFTEVFKYSKDEEGQKIWANRKSLTLEDRNNLMARRAISNDIDGVSDLLEQPANILLFLASPVKYLHNLGFAKENIGEGTARRQAMKYLEGLARLLYDTYYDRLSSLDNSTMDKMLEEFDQMSDSSSNMYSVYKNTDKLNLSREDKKYMLAKYIANEETGGSQFASKALGEDYQNMVAKSLSSWEKTVNSGAQFIDSGVGMLIRAGGMAGGLIGGVFGYGREEGEGYWENLIDNTLDNSVTRYGDNVATTNTYNIKDQERLKALGMSDNPILNTVSQQNSILSSNSVYELFGQYGFTAASTILSFGGAGIVNGITRGGLWLTKAANAGRALNSTSKGVRAVRTMLKAKDIGNLLVAGAVGTVEGGMNAVATRDETIKDLQQNIQDRYNQLISDDIDLFVNADPAAAASMLKASGYRLEDIPLPELQPMGKDGRGLLTQYSPESIQKLLQMMKQHPRILASFSQKYKSSIDSDMRAAKESADRAMYSDFIVNSVINGGINATFQATMLAPSILRAFSKYGIRKGNSIDDVVDIIHEKGGWKAVAKNATKKSVIFNRVKEGFGEGLEEYSQDISSAFGEGYAKDKMQQYLDKKYGGHPGATAMENDVWQSIGAGLLAAGNAAISQEAIKSGVYGGLSTLMGGPNVNFTRGKKGKLKDESKWAYFSRRSPVSWRSAITPLFSNRERDQINKDRQEITDNLNEFFSNKNVLDVLFNIEGTSAWLADLLRSIESRDEKTARDARLGAMLSTLTTLSSLRGTGYYDIVMGSLQARANFKLSNLQDSESAESKAVLLFIQAAQNRGQDISAENALTEIKKSASRMLDILSLVEKETADIEKIFGSNLDNDVKSSMVFNRLVINDYKKRSELLDKLLSIITDELNMSPSEKSTLGSRSKSLIARYGSLSKAEQALTKLEESKTDLEENIAELKLDIRTAEREAANDEALFGKLALRHYQDKLDKVKSLIRDIKSLVKAYKLSAGVETTFDKDGHEIGQHIKDSQVISAQEIMALSAEERAMMLSEKNKSRYSEELQAEIDKVNSVGTSILQEFSGKIADRGRVEQEYQQAIKSQYNLMVNPNALNYYVNQVKYLTLKRLLKEKNTHILDFERSRDYLGFANALNSIYINLNLAEIDAVLEMIGETSFYKRWANEKNQQDEILKYAISNGHIEETDTPAISTLMMAFDYLLIQGIDLMDDNALDVLSAYDLQLGISSFEEYLNKIKENAPAEADMVFTSVGEAIISFKNIMESYKKERAEREANAKPIDTEQTTPEQAAPVPAPEPGASTADDSLAEDTLEAPAEIPNGQTQEEKKKSIFDHAADTPEGAHLGPDGTPIDQGTSTKSDDPIIQAFEDNSPEEVARAAQVVINSIRNGKWSSPVINLAMITMEMLSQSSFDDVEEFLDTVNAHANAIEAQSEEGESDVANALRQGVAKAQANARRESGNEGEKGAGPTLPGSVGEGTGGGTGKGTAGSGNSSGRRHNMFPGSTPNSSFIASVNIASIRETYPDGALARYYDRYRIEEKLIEGALDGNPDVFFITDDALTSAVAEEMRDKGLNYNEQRSLPIVAVVESATGPITIDGKTYQPIGVMPSTNHSQSAGSAHMSAIRGLASLGQGQQLIKANEGTPIVTKPYGQIKAEPRDKNERNLHDVIESGMNDQSSNDKAQLRAMDKSKRRSHPAYQKAKSNFIKRLFTAKVNTSLGKRNGIFFRQDRLDGRTGQIEIFTKGIHETTARDSDKTFTEVANNGNQEEIINFNSRTRRAAQELGKFLGSFSTEEMIFDTDENGLIVPTEGAKSTLLRMAETLEGKISNFLYVSIGDGWIYSISPTMDTVESKRVMSVNLVNVNTNTVIPLTNIHEGMSEQEILTALAEFLTNLIMDNGQVRMKNAENAVVKWQVPHSDVDNMKSNKQAADNISDIYDDGILEAPATAFNYIVKGIAVNNPFSSNPITPRNSANPDNASPASPLNQPPQGQRGERPKNPALENAANIVKLILADSGQLELSEDLAAYVHKVTRIRYARVTSFIHLDRATGEAFDPNSGWALPSTSIGTGMDEFVRDFFAGVVEARVDNLEKFYPNANYKLLLTFMDQLITLRNSFIALGLTIVPRDVTLSGTVEIKDDKGVIHTVNVAGTVDLLAYDADGNFKIFDMKTLRSEISGKKEAKYFRLVSLYKKLLEDKYGVKVNSMELIPIKVDYPTPKGEKAEGREGVISYSVTDEKSKNLIESCQLIVNGRQFRNAKPSLLENIPATDTSLTIDWNDLTPLELALIKEYEVKNSDQGPEYGPEGPIDDSPTDPNNSKPKTPLSPAGIDPVLGVPIGGNSIGESFGMTPDEAALFENHNQGSSGSTIPIPAHLQWENLTDEQIESLEERYMDEATWSTLEAQEREQYLECG